MKAWQKNRIHPYVAEVMFSDHPGCEGHDVRPLEMTRRYYDAWCHQCMEQLSVAVDRVPVIPMIPMATKEDLEALRQIAEESSRSCVIGVSPKQKYCCWKYDDDTDSWDTECGHKFVFINDGDPGKDGFIYCPYCAGRLAKEL